MPRPEGLNAMRIEKLAAFVKGLDELTAQTGVEIGSYGPVPIIVKNADGTDDGGCVYEVSGHRDTDQATVYRLEPQR